MRIGIDLGGTNIAAGLVSGSGQILERLTRPTLPQRGSDAVIQDIILLSRDLMEQSPQPVEGVGVGFPGFVDGTGLIRLCPNLGWPETLFTPVLKAKLGVPVQVANDASVAAWAEATVGATRTAKSSIFLTLGTGVGGGIVLDGKLWNGRYGAAGEIGHMMVGENFYNCGCGKNGCLETYASATALIKYVQLLMESEDSILAGQNLDARVIFAAAQKGDKVAERAVNRLVRYLALGITNLVNILDPEIVALGGGLAAAGQQLFIPLQEAVQSLALVPSLAPPPIVAAQTGNDAGIIGAAMLGV